MKSTNALIHDEQLVGHFCNSEGFIASDIYIYISFYFSLILYFIGSICHGFEIISVSFEYHQKCFLKLKTEAVLVCAIVKLSVTRLHPPGELWLFSCVSYSVCRCDSGTFSYI